MAFSERQRSAEISRAASHATHSVPESAGHFSDAPSYCDVDLDVDLEDAAFFCTVFGG
jgi:hypothetical protein